MQKFYAFDKHGFYEYVVLQLTVRVLHMRPEAGQAPQECCLRVSLMPLRLNIDQVQIHKN